MDIRRHFDVEEEVIALSFAIRLILSDLEKDAVVERSLEALTDFGSAERVGLFLLTDEGDALLAAGGMDRGVLNRTETRVDLADTPCQHVLETKRIGSYNLTDEGRLPWPTFEPGQDGRRCLCTPLIAADNRPIGVVTFDQAADYHPSPTMIQPLIVLLTVVAISLENARLFKQAVEDGLTGVYVRRYFELRLAEERTRLERYGGRLALALVDMDRFKEINDTFGHQWGDEALKKVASTMVHASRHNLDVVCRYGGDEFVIIMPETDAQGALEAAERIREMCADLVLDHPGRPIRITVSIGLAIMELEAGRRAPDLLARADEALYRAKREGRNKVVMTG